VSDLLNKLAFLTRKAKDRPFSGGFGVANEDDRSWEDAYRRRWQYDKVVRSTHGVNCTGSCGWNVYVKGGIVTWETQVLDYPRTRPDLPDHEPRGCARGASASWYLYSANRIKYPLARRALLEQWREVRSQCADPVEAWRTIVEEPARAAAYKGRRGKGGFVRAEWDELLELCAAANVYTIEKYGPDRVAGFSPIPAMSMVSYAGGARYVSLLGGTTLSFYDWYADLPPASPQTFGEQTDVPESADWYNADFIIVWGSNVPQTRTPDAHFLAEVRYRGAKTVVITPDFSEASKFADLWLDPKQGTDAALGLALGHVVLREFHVQQQVPYFLDYCRKYSDMPFLVQLEEQGGRWIPGRLLRASDFDHALGQVEHAAWKPVAFDERSDAVVVPAGSIGFRWDGSGRWNLAEREGTDGKDVRLRLTLADGAVECAEVAFPYFGGRAPDPTAASRTPDRHAAPGDVGVQSELQVRPVPYRTLRVRAGDVRVATIYDLMLAHYGVPRGLSGERVYAPSDPAAPYTPRWQEPITGIAWQKVEAVARELAHTAARTQGRCMIIIGTGVNQWFHGDMTYRSVINLLTFCGCVGQSGGGFAHYVGQEKLRPAAGWAQIAFGLDWHRPPRQMNGTSYWYTHTDQWRYEKLGVDELISPTADPDRFGGSLIDYNVRAVRMGWLPSSPQLLENPLQVGRRIAEEDAPAAEAVAAGLASGELRLAVETPDDPRAYPRNLFVWRSNLLGSSGKGHEYFLKHLIGAKHGVLADDLAARGEPLPREVEWAANAPEGKLDLLVTIDFRMSTTCMYSDVILPTATWYEKNDLSTTDMHPFIHPLTAAVDPLWECRSDWDIFRGLAKQVSALAPGHLGVEHDVVLQPLMHDSPAELGQPFGVADWKRGECAPIPGQTMPSVTLVERDYPNTYQKFTAIGPLLASAGNGIKGVDWGTERELDLLRRRTGSIDAPGIAWGLPRLVTDRDAAEAILALSPETNGAVAVRAWGALEKTTGLSLTHLAAGREAESIRFDDLVAQPRKVITSPTWSGLESEEHTYNGSYLNVHEGIPWRTLTGRIELYQDHEWMRAFGESLAVYRPPIDTKAIPDVLPGAGDGSDALVLSFLTPHQKWGIHSSFTDTQIMLTLSRGGPCVWLSEEDAAKIGIEDNDWIEVSNLNGALTARAVVSQRVKTGSAMMYHSQDKTVNTPGSETTGTRGIHNSVSKIVIKPTHMIGGYAQLSYGFNYYGTVGANRDDFVVVRKLAQIDWLDGRGPRPVK
jgi:nitrate reductase alpha subunit